tara:strand:- start:155 stop:1195 length:1041 start_codon:yes stop_codon:yes gene_type:complete
MAYTTIDNPELHFQAKVYTADSSANRLITLDGSENMQPDWVWMKNRDQSVNHDLYDSVRGTTKYISSNKINAEATNADGLVGFNTDGFTVDTSWGNISTGNSYVAWCWKAGGSASSNSNGSITSSVSASTDAGFSIVSYTGTGSDANVGHGLSSAPELIITKSRSTTGDWKVHTSAIDGSWDVGTLNSTSAFGNSSYTASTNSIFYVGSGAPTNASSVTYVSYLLHSVKGYSKFGSYTGNGSLDAPFIHLGFKPAWLMIKRTDTTNSWVMFDNKRNAFNVVDKHLFANTTDPEDSSANYNEVDFLSNGFKLREDNNTINASGGTYIFMAFAESPFTNSSGVPNNAR